MILLIILAIVAVLIYGRNAGLHHLQHKFEERLIRAIKAVCAQHPRAWRDMMVIDSAQVIETVPVSQREDLTDGVIISFSFFSED